MDLALTALDRAQTQGSAAAAYLKVVLSAFLEPRWVHHDLRNVLSPWGVDEVGVEQIRAEASGTPDTRTPSGVREAAAGTVTTAAMCRDV